MSQSTSPTNLSDLLNSLGLARRQMVAAKKVYDDYRGVVDELKTALSEELQLIGLKSAKGVDFTASMVERPTVIVTHEPSAIDWLKHAPDIEFDHYVGLKSREFQGLALSILKNTGEMIDGTQVMPTQYLSIKENKEGNS